MGHFKWPAHTALLTALGHTHALQWYTQQASSAIAANGKGTAHVWLKSSSPTPPAQPIPGCCIINTAASALAQVSLYTRKTPEGRKGPFQRPFQKELSLATYFAQRKARCACLQVARAISSYGSSQVSETCILPMQMQYC